MPLSPTRGYPEGRVTDLDHWRIVYWPINRQVVFARKAQKIPVSDREQSSPAASTISSLQDDGPNASRLMPAEFGHMAFGIVRTMIVFDKSGDTIL
jgi:hypothetical protein